VRRGPLWHERHPGDMIHGMAWFEIMYLEKLRKNKKQIARYIKNGPKGYSSEIVGKIKMRQDVKALHSLIKTNKGRIKMRQALGLSLNDNLETVLKRHWLLGDFLNKDKLKVKKVKINSDIKKRKELLAKYKSALTRYKNKLDEERRATN
jgi:transcriptional antiterminator